MLNASMESETADAALTQRWRTRLYYVALAAIVGAYAAIWLTTSGDTAWVGVSSLVAVVLISFLSRVMLPARQSKSSQLRE